MEPSITSVELQRVCRAWEMNNGVYGFEEFNNYHYHGDSGYSKWVDEKSLHKSYLHYGWPLIEWLLKKSEE